jgi:hypothetical protein
MPTPLLATARPSGLLLLAEMLVLGAAGCSPSNPSPRMSPSFEPGSLAPAPTATATPSPEPTPVFTNPADPELAALIPAKLGAQTISIPTVDQFSVTPGDIGEVYGEIGLRFVALQVAYVERPRLSLYAMRVRAPSVTTRELEPYLATAAQYVGIAGLHREPWKLAEVAGRPVWVRPEDNATAAGTMIYTWAADEYVFLLIGVDDALNHALLAALPGEPLPTPTPRPSNSAAPTSPQPTASPASN